MRRTSPTRARRSPRRAMTASSLARRLMSMCRQSIAALEAGLPVLLEKPVAPDLAGARRLAAAVDGASAPLLMGYTWRWWPPLRKVRALLGEGAIGTIRHVQFHMSAHLADWHPWERYQDFFMARREMGGGALLDESHWIDLMLWLFGMPASVSGRIEKISDLEIDSDDNVDLLFAYDGGPRVSMHLDLYGRPHEKFIRFVGSEGTLFWSADPNQIRIGRGWQQDWETETFDLRAQRHVRRHRQGVPRRAWRQSLRRHARSRMAFACSKSSRRRAAPAAKGARLTLERVVLHVRGPHGARGRSRAGRLQGHSQEEFARGRREFPWSVESATWPASLDWLDACVLSTDDPEIAEEGRRHGLDVPFLRPDHLAGDLAGSHGVWRHALARGRSSLRQAVRHLHSAGADQSAEARRGRDGDGEGAARLGRTRAPSPSAPRPRISRRINA